jgi:hypothetical protein
MIEHRQYTSRRGVPAAADIEGTNPAPKFSEPGRLSARAGGRQRKESEVRLSDPAPGDRPLYALAGFSEQDAAKISLKFSPLAGNEAKQITMNDAESLRRRAENLHALAKKARDDNYTQLADYILDRADQLFEEANIREFDGTATE